METRNRYVWIVVAAVLVIACCCALAGAATAGVWLSGSLVSRCDCDADTGFEGRHMEKTFAVGPAPTLKIDNFAGNVTVRAGESGAIRMVATRKASSTSYLEQIWIAVDEHDGGLRIRAQPSCCGRMWPVVSGNKSVDLEITAPAETHLDLELGAGNATVRGLSSGVKANVGAGIVDIADVEGEIEARSGAGTIMVHGATGAVRLENGAGAIIYEGTPLGDCRFESGIGVIGLTLPADPDVEVHLDTGAGSIDLDCDVDGHVTKREVRGTIGSGHRGEIRAESGMGEIDMICR
jgi:hypothetical protein